MGSTFSLVFTGNREVIGVLVELFGPVRFAEKLCLKILFVDLL